MNKLLIAAGVGAMTWTAVAAANPVEMTDQQLTAVTAAGYVSITNKAIATNVISASGGSAAVKCAVLCLAVNVPVQSGNISTYYISQVAVAKAGNK